jgi:hypothetical protein
LPAIGISISFWPAADLRGFLAGFFEALVSAAAWRSAGGSRECGVAAAAS